MRIRYFAGAAEAAGVTEETLDAEFEVTVADLVEQGATDFGMEASMAKMRASDLAMRIATEAVQMHGGYGYMVEYPVARAYVDARIQRIYGGANEIMKEVIARSLVGR